MLSVLLNNSLQNIIQFRPKKLEIKSVFLRTYLGKSFDPKIDKNCLVEINEFNGAVLVNFWVKRFSQVRS